MANQPTTQPFGLGEQTTTSKLTHLSIWSPSGHGLSHVCCWSHVGHALQSYPVLTRTPLAMVLVLTLSSQKCTNDFLFEFRLFFCLFLQKPPSWPAFFFFFKHLTIYSLSFSHFQPWDRFTLTGGEDVSCVRYTLTADEPTWCILIAQSR